MKLIASPCSWSWVRCWRQLRNALFIAGTCFTRTVPQLRSAPPSCQPGGKWCTSQKQTYREVIFDLPHHPPPKVRDMTTSNNSPPRAQRAGIVPVVARGVVTSLIELCINDILENQKPLSLFSSNCVPPFSCCFRFLLKFSALKKFTTTGAGYGPLPRSNRYAI